MAKPVEDPRRALLRQLAELRGRLDPAALNQFLEKIDGWEPYDREAAGEAVRQFLATRTDGGKFQERLVDAMKKGRDEG